MKIIKVISTGVLVIAVSIAFFDFIITKFGKKKNYELKQKGAVVQTNLAKGILVYGNPTICFYKWEIDSINEVKAKDKNIYKL